MNKTFWIRFLDSCSDNRKSKTCTEQCRSIQNRKLVGIVALAVAFAMCGAVAQAQPLTKTPRIGFLAGVSPSTIPGRTEAFRHGLRELGYVEGENIIIEWRYAEEKLDHLNDLAAELVRLKVEVIVSAAPTVTRSVRKRRKPSPLSWRSMMIPLTTGSSPASRDRAGTLLDYQTFLPR